MKEEYDIEIESKGGYDSKKEFRKRVNMTEREYLALVNRVLDFIDLVEKNGADLPVIDSKA